MLKKEVLIIDGGTGRLLQLEQRLDELGFSVIKTQDPSWVPNLIEASPPLALLLVDAVKLDAKDCQHIVRSINLFSKETPIFWSADAAKRQSFQTIEASQYHHYLNGHPDKDLLALDKVLKDRFFPKIVAYSLEFSSKLAMLQSFHFEPETIRAFIRADNTSLASINSVISFSGSRAMGCLNVSGNRETFERIGQEILPSNGQEEQSRALAVAGELCTMIMGRFKAFLDQNGFSVTITWPLTTEGFPTSFIYAPGRLVLAVELIQGADQLFVELCLDSFDRRVICQKGAPASKTQGEVSFFSAA